MKNIRKIIAGLLISLMTTLAYLSTVVLSAENIDASVTVEAFCGIQVNTNPITFQKSGNPDPTKLTPGQTSDEITRTVKNSGTSGQSECRYLIKGNNWGTTLMDVKQTDYKCTDSIGTEIDCDADSFTDLTLSDVDFLGLDADTTANVDFQVSIPNNQASGTYNQVITITLSS